MRQKCNCFVSYGSISRNTCKVKEFSLKIRDPSEVELGLEGKGRYTVHVHACVDIESSELLLLIDTKPYLLACCYQSCNQTTFHFLSCVYIHKTSCSVGSSLLSGKIERNKKNDWTRVHAHLGIY